MGLRLLLMTSSKYDPMRTIFQKKVNIKKKDYLWNLTPNLNWSYKDEIPEAIRMERTCALLK
jgi:hypothetical protein